MVLMLFLPKLFPEVMKVPLFGNQATEQGKDESEKENDKSEKKEEKKILAQFVPVQSEDIPGAKVVHWLITSPPPRLYCPARQGEHTEEPNGR